MSVASLEVIQYSIIDIWHGVNGDEPIILVDFHLYVILGIGILLKLILYLYCNWAVNLIRESSVSGTDMLNALAEDHLNGKKIYLFINLLLKYIIIINIDVWSNTVALITASIACNVANNSAWWVDPAGAILISVAIIYRWISIMQEQIQKVVGHTAPPEFIEKIIELAASHDQRLIVDCTRAYHFGARYNVEMEIVLPGRMTVMESHDIALALQHKIESFDNVERAFVHVDHQERDGLEHKVERELNKNIINNSNETTNILHGSSTP